VRAAIFLRHVSTLSAVQHISLDTKKTIQGHCCGNSAPLIVRHKLASDWQQFKGQAQHHMSSFRLALRTLVRSSVLETAWNTSILLLSSNIPIRSKHTLKTHKGIAKRLRVRGSGQLVRYERIEAYCSCCCSISNPQIFY